MSKLLSLLALPLLFAACATAPKPLTGFNPEKKVETVQSSIAVSIKTPERSAGGRGYLVYRHPDQLRVAVLSPFGSTVLEFFSDGERITAIIPSRQIAYSGPLSEVPDQGVLKNWGLIRWVMERPPVNGPVMGARELVMADSRREKIFFDDNGLIKCKETEDGDKAVYNIYQNISGVAFPESIEISNRAGGQVKITFDEPEVNQPVEESAFVPNLQGMTVLPLSEFRGI